MQDAILLKICTDIWLEFALQIYFYAGHEQLIKVMLGNLTNTLNFA